MSNESRRRVLSRALAESKDGEIQSCDACDGFALSNEMHTHIGSMCKEMAVCPECDLPEKWQIKFSESRGIRYYIYFDPEQPHTRHIRWSHPTPGNPLYRSDDLGQVHHMTRKRKK